jgi:hypothetical protein
MTMVDVVNMDLKSFSFTEYIGSSSSSLLLLLFVVVVVVLVVISFYDFGNQFKQYLFVVTRLMYLNYMKYT